MLMALTAALPMAAQDGGGEWEPALEAITTDDDFDEGFGEANYDVLTELMASPININGGSRKDLLGLPFLTERQVDDIGKYIYVYGPMHSPSELMMIESIDYQTLQLLLPFIYFGDAPEEHSASLGQLLGPAKHELTVFVNVPTYTRRGDEEAYLGSRYKHWLRYNLWMGGHVQAGFSASQDAGEPFFKGRNSRGYDFYSGYVMMKDMGMVETLCLGTFRLSSGMGLVANSGFSLGKSSALQSFGRQASGLKGYSSRSEGNYFRGAALALNLSGSARLTGFVSHKKMDATLNGDSTAATLLYTGYHRTETEMAKKHNTSLAAAGLDLSASMGNFTLGATAIYSHLDRRLAPSQTALYKRYYARGQDFLNMGVNYSYVSPLVAVRGETAINRHGNLATLNLLTIHCSTALNLMLLQRFYSYKYTSLYASSFSEGSRVQNESGVYLGLSWKYGRALLLNFYADYAHFPFARYQVSSPSDAFDTMLSLAVYKGNWTLKGRYRLHLKQKDYTDGDGTTTLVNRLEHKMRLSAEWKRGSLSAQMQVDASMIDIGYPPAAADDGPSRGIMIGGLLGWKPELGGARKLSLTLSGKYFTTDDYDSRLYAYESGMLYTYSSASYYGHGIRYAAMAKWEPSRMLMLAAKVGVTDYFDRQTIGTSYQMINASSKCDIEIEARLRL